MLPSNAKWIKDRAVSIDPKKGVVHTKNGDEIQYEYVVIAVGLKNDYDKVCVFLFKPLLLIINIGFEPTLCL